LAATVKHGKGIAGLCGVDGELLAGDCARNRHGPK